ncbi:AraC family transcriptional regulator [Butyrivibrio sp. INlla21]|uniref:AraC family transcriptional regulator n=1 Tax=Butyrivibrio sp. INlla21 TaxID=1520811 RepID=UPI0008EEDCFF|nr:AraC family transcriptional regulator [Butyrivibrio sp. INlla21]SFU64749.1 AraC-type DNA-binding protein [Butyrivibrio sp. INlla21]
MDEQRKAVRKMQDYISEHITEEIDITALAKAVSFSPWYARKLFIKYLGMTPAVYIRRLKLSKSALCLRDEKNLILDIAMEMGFGSVDGYQRAFRREFGCNPKEYATSPVPIWLFTPSLIMEKERNVSEMSETRNVFIQVVERPERKVIIKRGIKATEYWSYCKEVGCDVWGLLTSIKSITGEPVCLWLSKQLIKPGTSEYVQGVEVEPTYKGCVPEGFEVIDLPKTSYLLFRGEPFAEENYEQAIGEIWDAEKKYNPEFIGYKWDDNNPRIQLEPIGERGYIELVPVKEV